MVVLQLTCSVCKIQFSIPTNHLQAYTPEVRRTWICAVCNDPRKRVIVKKEEKMSEVIENAQPVQAETGKEVLITEDDIKTFLGKVKAPSSWIKEWNDRYHAGSKSLTQFTAEIASVIDAKARTRSLALEQRKKDLVALYTKTLFKVLKIEKKA